MTRLNVRELVADLNAPLDFESLPPWLRNAGVLKPGDTGARLLGLLEEFARARDAALREVGRADLIDGVDVGQSPELLEVKTITYRANLLGVSAAGIPVYACRQCYLADIEDDCPGVTVTAALVTGRETHS